MKTFAALLLFVATATASQICASEKIGFTYADGDSCTKFRQCTPAGDLVFECPAGTYFNRDTRMCDCGAGKVCGGTSYGKCPLTVDTDVCTGKPMGQLVEHVNTCDAFYQCSSFGPALFACPEGKSFNPTTKTCDLAKNVKCARRGRCCGGGGGGGSGCCQGGGWNNGCRPCGGWTQQICCVPCVPCQCVPCGTNPTTSEFKAF
jgi:Chitin binding Peritrophin-A domain